MAILLQLHPRLLFPPLPICVILLPLAMEYITLWDAKNNYTAFSDDALGNNFKAHEYLLGSFKFRV